MSQQKNQNMETTLFHFQSLSVNNGLRILNESNGLLLSSETGLGKTIVASEIARNLQLKTLIVSPKHVQKNWQTFTSGIDVTICGNRSFPEGDYGLIIIDEVHRIGGAASYLNLRKLIKPKTKVIAISATPYNNDVGSICDIIALLNLKGYARYIADAACTNLCITAAKLDKVNRFLGENPGFKKIGEKVEIEFVAYEVNDVFMFMGGYPTREAQLEPGSYIVKPRQRYQIHEDRVHCPTTQFNTVTELWDATESYDKDMRIKGVITQNVESVVAIGYRNSEPTIRKINTSALNHARSVPVDKEIYKALRQVFSGGMLCYPFGKIWNQLNTKVPKGMDAKEFITEQLSKLVEYGDPNQNPFFVIAELEKC